MFVNLGEYMTFKPVSIKLNNSQIQLLRGVLYEFYNQPNSQYQDLHEKQLHQELETILAKAENDSYQI